MVDCKRIRWYISHIHTRLVKKERTSDITALSEDSFLKANGSTALQQRRSAMSWSGVTVFRGRFLITAPRTKYLKPNWIGSIKAIHVSHSWTTISIICHKMFCCQCSTCYCNLLIFTKEEGREYIQRKLEGAGCTQSIFDADVVEAILNASTARVISHKNFPQRKSVLNIENSTMQTIKKTQMTVLWYN